MNSFLEKYPFEIPGINYKRFEYFDDNCNYEETEEDDDPENWMSL